jgi:hypothetical protein
MNDILLRAGTVFALECYLESLETLDVDEVREMHGAEFDAVYEVLRAKSLRALSESPLAIETLDAWSEEHAEMYPEECAALDSDLRAAESLRVA